MGHYVIKSWHTHGINPDTFLKDAHAELPAKLIQKIY